MSKSVQRVNTQAVEVIAKAIKDAEQSFLDLLPSFMQGQQQRFMALALEAATSTDLLECYPPTIVSSIAKAAQLGLPIDKTHAAIVPFWNEKAKRKDAQLIPMFQGLIVAAMRNGGVKKVWSSVVYAEDQFRYVLGSDPRLEHEPRLDSPQDIRKAVCVYACMKLASDEVVFEVMTPQQVAILREGSKAKNGPWADRNREPEMWRKSAVRKLAKYVPKSPDLQMVLDVDDEQFEGPREPEFEVAPSSGPAKSIEDLARRAQQPRGPDSSATTPEAKPTRVIEMDPGAAQVSPADEPPREAWFAGVRIDQLVLDDSATLGVPMTRGMFTGMNWHEAVRSTKPEHLARVQSGIETAARETADKGVASEGGQTLALACKLAHEAGELPWKVAS